MVSDPIREGAVVDCAGLLSPNIVVLAPISQGAVIDLMGFLSPNIMIS